MINTIDNNNQKKQLRVCMISSLHDAADRRIYERECVTLAKNGYEVIHLCYGKKTETFLLNNGVKVIRIKKEKRRMTTRNILLFIRQLYLFDLYIKAKSLHADIYHLHDLELCRIAIPLQKLSHHPKVIYDSHEPYWDNFKDYWKKKSIFQVMFNFIPSLIAERKLIPKMDFLIATEDNVAATFLKRNPKTAIIYNYPVSCYEPDVTISREYDVVYSGSLLESKGILLMINALIVCKKRGYELNFLFLGQFYDPKFEAYINDLIKWNRLENNVCFTGEVSFYEVRRFYHKSKIGFCLFPDNRTNRLILPVKLFEYMASGLPIVGSDFGHIKRILEIENAGICVDPKNIEAVADAIIVLLNGDYYHKYAEHNIEVVRNKYCWSHQEPEFLKVYSELTEYVR